MTPVGRTTTELDRERLRGAARQLEALVLKQLVNATKAFTGGEGAGSALRADLFADALADAMVEGGGVGLERQIVRSVLGPREASGGLDLAAPVPASSAGAPPAGGGMGKVTSGFGLRHDPFDGHQPIARVGQSGRATGDHLHLEVRVGGREVDPTRALKKYELRADGSIESGSWPPGGCHEGHGHE